MKEKPLTILLCLVGLSGVSYGMIEDNNGIFIIGVVCVIAGYLLIRRRLKESIQKRS